MLDYCGQLLESDQSLLMQTHINETEEEILATAALFPKATDYLDVYSSFGLLGDRSHLRMGSITRKLSTRNGPQQVHLWSIVEQRSLARGSLTPMDTSRGD